jgi:RNA polymerase sigma-70 factor (ECF subfamily)
MIRETQNTLKDLYDDHVDELYRFAFFKMQSHDDEATDIVQQAFYKLWIELSWWKDIENKKAYLYRIVGNKIIDFYRKNKPISLDEQIESLGDILEGSSDIENETHTKLEVEKIYRILAWLSDNDRDIFILRYVEELSPKQIAERYDLDINTLTVKLHRLKEKIKASFPDI